MTIVVDWLTTGEAARILAVRGRPVSAETMRRWCATGQIEGARRLDPSPRWLIPRRWLDERTKDLVRT